jgi:group I intron endonuclease
MFCLDKSAKSQECYGFIYKITNAINNKIYIGQTIQSINKRFKNHLFACYHEKMPLHRAIRKYGKDKFNIEIIDFAMNSEELNKKEIFYIEKLNTIKNGYNVDLGGGVFTRTPETELKRIKGIKDAKRGIYPESFRLYANSRKDHKYTREERQKMSDVSPHKKGVIAKNEITGEILTFKSGTEAAKYFNCQKQIISRACLKKRRHHRNFIFNFIEQDLTNVT